jgi:outer membrane protein TolC
MNYRESRYREFERRVTPGATQDRIEVTEYETRRESATGSRSRRERESNGAGGLKDEERSFRGLRENSTRKIVGRTVTYEDHDDVTKGDDTWSFLIRWQLPNPWEQKAKVAVAEAEILAADWVLKKTVEETILAVRELYDELVEAELKQKNAAATAKYRYGTTATAAIEGKMAKAAEGASAAQLESLEMRLKGRQLRSEIVSLTGIKDPSRISVPGAIQKRSVSLSGLDFEYLSQMASIHRADYNIIRAKKAAARAKVDEENSKKIPWAAFADVGVNHQDSARGRDSTEWQFRLGVSLPFFSWFKNKAVDVAKEESRAFSRQEGAFFELIQAELETALANLKDADATMRAAAEEVRQARIFLQQAQGAAMISDKPLAAQSDAKEFEMGLQNALQPFTIEYNKAVMMLERALGTRIENIFIRE